MTMTFLYFRLLLTLASESLYKMMLSGDGHHVAEADNYMALKSTKMGYLAFVRSSKHPVRLELPNHPNIVRHH